MKQFMSRSALKGMLKSTKEYTDEKVETSNSQMNDHAGDVIKHITSSERSLWNTVSNKVDKVSGKGLSTNDFTDALLSKLNGIAAGANKTTVDSALSSTSTNPVQNKVINSALAGKAASNHTHSQYVESISDLGITATADEINYVDGVTSNIQTQLNSKAASSHTHDNRYYTESEMNTKLNAKANLASPTLTGTPKAPTATAGTNTTQIATTAFTQTTVSNHNSSGSSHSDIRELISNLTTRLNGLADSDDATLDQLSEIVSYIKSNRTLIENVTTNKLNVADIINNLTSTATTKPLSAAQGKILNDLITSLSSEVEESKYTHPTYTAKKSGLYKITVDSTGHVSAATEVQKADITALGIPDNLDDKLDKNNPEATGSFSLGRKQDSTVGASSFVCGSNITASGANSHAEGINTIAVGDASHAEGNGSATSFNGRHGHAEGYKTSVSGANAHAEGSSTSAAGNAAHAEGYGTSAFGYYSHAEGDSTKAEENSAHAEGMGTVASGEFSHAEGENTEASGTGSHSEGVETLAKGSYSHAEGNNIVANDFQHAQGHYNSSTNAGSTQGIAGTAFVIGNGSQGSLSNAFRVTYSGYVFSKGSYNTSGADYAEYAEWADGNPNDEDRRGYFVTFDEEKTDMIRIANEGDDILGIVSGNPCIIGNSDEEWFGRRLFDEFGTMETEEVEVEVEYYDEGKKQTKMETITKYKDNPEYDPNQTYVHRSERKEWSAIGWIGVLSVRDDGTCVPGGYCKPTNGGIATKAERGNDSYRVLSRVTESIVKVALK